MKNWFLSKRFIVGLHLAAMFSFVYATDTLVKKTTESSEKSKKTESRLSPKQNAQRKKIVDRVLGLKLDPSKTNEFKNVSTTIKTLTKATLSGYQAH